MMIIEGPKDYIKESIEVKKLLFDDAEILKTISDIIVALCGCLKGGGKILIAGNGGSAADAQHFAAELVGRYKLERKPYSAVALTTDTSFLTACSNDYDFKMIFARQVEALGRPGDVFVGISTSGNSLNIIEGIGAAKQKGLRTVTLLGKNGGKLKGTADFSIVVPSDNTPRIQEAHIMLIHIICEEIEKLLA